MIPLQDGEYQPAQYPKEGGLLEIDFRSLAASADRSSIPNRDSAHPSGGKRKRSEDDAEPVDMDVPAEQLANGEPAAKRRAYDNVSGKVSGRPWKARFTRASAAGVRAPSDWSKKMDDKAQRKAIQNHVSLVKAEAKGKAVAERKRRTEVAVRREANRKAAVKVQAISNPKTLKKLTKKQAQKVWAVQKLGQAPAAAKPPPAVAPKRKKK